MRRPPTELRKMEDEERRRARAHSRLLWERRVHKVVWVAAGLAAIAVIAFVAHLTGVIFG